MWEPSINSMDQMIWNPENGGPDGLQAANWYDVQPGKNGTGSGILWDIWPSRTNAEEEAEKAKKARKRQQASAA